MYSNTIYLLTGAAGFLGSNVSRQLIKNGKRVRALVLENDPAERYVPKEVEIIKGNLLNTVSLEKFFSVHESEIIVIHCASFVTVKPEFNQKVYDVNVTGTKNIIDMCLKYKVKKLVYVSSTGAIPELKKGTAILEVDNFDPKKIVGCYGQTKAEATQLVLDAARQKGLNASVVFPSGICGPNDFAFGFFAKFIMDYVNGHMKTGIEGSFNAVDVRDLADGIICCVEKGRSGEGYIMSNDVVTIRDIFHIISEATGAAEVKRIISIPLAKIIAFFMKIKSKLTKKPAALTSYAIYNLERNNSFSCLKTEKELGFTKRSFEQSLVDTVEWLKAEGKINLKTKNPPKVVFTERIYN